METEDILSWFEGKKAVTFQAGDILLQEGGQDSKLFVLIEGEIEVTRRDTRVTHVDEPGSIFGEMSVLLDMPHSATVQALSKVRAYVVDDALAFLEAHPDVSLHLATLLARRLYYTTSYLVDLQQQAAGRREDLDLVDKILGTLFQKPQPGGKAKKPTKASRK
jgi:CRP-like cAMP-binding protein